IFYLAHGADVPWLSTSPISGTIPGGTQHSLGVESGFTAPAAAQQVDGSRGVTLSLEASGVAGTTTAAAPAAPAEAVSLVLDDGSRDNDIGAGGTVEFLFVNRFTPAPDEFPFDLNQIQVYFSSIGLVNVGDDML